MATPSEQDRLARLLSGPALGPPAGVTSNFDDPANMRAGLLAYNIIFLVAATLALWIRLETRLRERRFLVEDYFLTAAWLVYAFCFHVLAFLVLDVDPAVHQWDLRMRDMSLVLRLSNALAAVYCIDVLLLKVAILLQCQRILTTPGERNALFWTTQLLLWTNALAYMVSAFILLFQCSPRSKIWEPWAAGGSCLDMRPASIFAAIFNITSDLAILALPQKLLWRTEMGTRRRIAVSLILLLGILACVAASVRVHYIFVLASAQDRSYWGAITGMTSVAELGLGFLTVCPLSRFASTVSGSKLASSVMSVVILCPPYIASRSRSASRYGSRKLPDDRRPPQPQPQPQQAGSGEYDNEADNDHNKSAGYHAAVIASCLNIVSAQQQRPQGSGADDPYDLPHIVFPSSRGSDGQHSLSELVPAASRIVRTVETDVSFSEKR